MGGGKDRWREGGKGEGGNKGLEEGSEGGSEVKEGEVGEGGNERWMEERRD